MFMDMTKFSNMPDGEEKPAGKPIPTPPSGGDGGEKTKTK